MKALCLLLQTACAGKIPLAHRLHSEHEHDLHHCHPIRPFSWKTFRYVIGKAHLYNNIRIKLIIPFSAWVSGSCMLAHSHTVMAYEDQSITNVCFSCYDKRKPLWKRYVVNKDGQQLCRAWSFTVWTDLGSLPLSHIIFYKNWHRWQNMALSYSNLDFWAGWMWHFCDLFKTAICQTGNITAQWPTTTNQSNKFKMRSKICSVLLTL